MVSEMALRKAFENKNDIMFRYTNSKGERAIYTFQILRFFRGKVKKHLLVAGIVKGKNPPTKQQAGDILSDPKFIQPRFVINKMEKFLELKFPYRAASREDWARWIAFIKKNVGHDAGWLPVMRPT